MSINSVVLMGRLCGDPELKTTPSGVSVTNFSLAVDRKFQPSGEERKADFIPVVAWRNTAEFICQYFKKGSMIGLEGELQSRSFTDKNGNARTAFEVIASNVSFCGSKSEGNNEAPPGITQNVPKFEDVTDEGLPF